MSASTRHIRHVFVIASFLGLAAPGFSADQQRERSSVPDRYKWDLAQI
jgi:hypothetical protein